MIQQALQREERENSIFLRGGIFYSCLPKDISYCSVIYLEFTIRQRVTHQILYEDTDPTLQHLDFCILKSSKRFLSFLLTPIFTYVNYQILKNLLASDSSFTSSTSSSNLHATHLLQCCPMIYQFSDQLSGKHGTIHNHTQQYEHFNLVACMYNISSGLGHNTVPPSADYSQSKIT